MKKLKLRALSLGAREILNREQLKSIMGGCTSDSECDSHICDSHGACVGGEDSGSTGGSGGYENGSGDYNPCPSGQAICHCANNGATLGCMSALDCSNQNSPVFPGGCY